MIRKKQVYALKGWQWWVLRLLMPMYSLWGWTLSLRICPSSRKTLKGLKEPALFIFWHNRLFCAPFFAKKFFRARKMAGLVSASKDGAWLAAIFKCLKVKAIRGSSSFRGSTSLKEILTATDEGWDVAITPDGPRGPCYRLAKGSLWVAEKTNKPIVLCSWRYMKAWRLPSWDRFYLPKPFSTVEIALKYYPNYEALLAAAGNEDLATYVRLSLLDLGKDAD
jgi:lysophospholipid acyltransferase (LPLAT)-like uncharacterized protein